MSTTPPQRPTQPDTITVVALSTFWLGHHCYSEGDVLAVPAHSLDRWLSSGRVRAAADDEVFFARSREQQEQR